MKLNLFILICFGYVQQISAQDQLIKTNSDTIKCIIKEIGDEEIKYLSPDMSESILFGINKDLVNKVILANGNILEFSEYLYDPQNYVSNKKNNIKIGFLSPLFNSTNICFEKSIEPGRSFETTLGIIGAGWDTGDYNESGIFIKFGYKFIKSPDYYLKGQKFAHILKGTYIRPEVAFSSYAYDYYGFDYISFEESPSSRQTNYMGAILLNFGKQWIFENGFVVDCFIGVGYGFGDDEYSFGLHKAFIGGVKEFPLALTSGIRVGWNF